MRAFVPLEPPLMITSFNLMTSLVPATISTPAVVLAAQVPGAAPMHPGAAPEFTIWNDVSAGPTMEIEPVR